MADQDLGSQLQRLESKVEDLKNAQTGAKNAGRIVAVAILITAIGMIAFAILPFINLARDPEPLKTQLQVAVERELAPQAQVEMQLLMREVLPAYEAAMGRVMDESYPMVAARLDSEFTQFRRNMADGAEERVAGMSRRIFEENEQLLLEWLPELASESDPNSIDEQKAEDYAGRLARVIENAGSRAAEDLFGDHFEALSRLELAFEGFEVPSDVAVLSDQDLRDHIAATIARITDESLDPPDGE